ncbi:ATP-binding protein [Phenylobacterium sp.]|uniref:hybrid sensor histidine kinase/response regulator n=1 Tax=Phenylobacterium sp. TaxID=1871053 RepID=UPI003BAD4013
MSLTHALPTESLEALVEHMDRAQRLANAGSWHWNIETNGIIWSPQIYRIFGLKPFQFSPSYPAFLRRIHPGDRDMVTESVRRAIDLGEPYDIDHRIVLPNGTTRVVHEQGEVERAPDGRAVGMLGAVQDVTDLRAAEAASRRNVEMLATMLRISPEAIVVSCSRGRILQFSAGAELMFGYAAAEVVGQGIEILMPDRSRKSHPGHVRKFLKDSRPSLRMHERSIIFGQRKGGEEFPAEASLAKLETGDGVAFTTIIRDLSAWHASEARLNEARERAERASLAKSVFLANMSHEIRTPLNGVLGVTSALAKTPLNPRQRDMVRLVETSGRALEGLLSDILDLAKIDSGRISVRAEPFGLARVVEDVCTLFDASASQKGLQLRFRVEDDLAGQFVGDDLRLRQVLSNFLSNAIKFTEQGEVRLHVLRGGGERIRFVVEDTGIGFSPELADRLFDRFEQADGSITRRFGGTGLGLAISKSLVELMGGTISAVSTPGRGSTFAFEVPLKPGAAESAACLEPCTPIPSEVAGSLRILLAEDHPINQMTVQMILEDLPVQLVCVENGAEALERLAEQPFDLVLMDMQMPVMDGLTAIRRIREREAAQGRDRVPVCTLTANAFPEHEREAFDAGSDYFLAKPINAQALIELVCMSDKGNGGVAVKIVA